MRIEHLPWEAVSGHIYEAKDPKPRKKWVYVGGWILATVFLIIGVAMRYYLVLIFGVLYLLALIMRRNVVVTKRGVETFNQMYITTHYDIWTWDEMSYVLYEDREKPGLTALLFNRGERVKRLYFDNDDAVQIVKMAKELKPGIITGEADDYKGTFVEKKKKSRTK